MKQHQDLLHLAIDVAEGAARHVRNHERPADPRTWDRKGLRDFVTEVDRSTERFITGQLLDAEPSSLVLGEELSPEVRAADLLWIVDPLDGTTNYLHDYPAYAVSIGAALHGELVVGVVVDVPARRTYHAVGDGGAWHDAARLRVSSTARPSDALIGTGFPFKAPHMLPEYFREFESILHGTSGIRRAGAASLDFVDIALGRFDGFWEPYLAPWDVAAGALIVREAGGMVSDYAGNEEVLRHGGFVAGNPHIHTWLLETLAALHGEAR